MKPTAKLWWLTPHSRRLKNAISKVSLAYRSMIARNSSCISLVCMDPLTGGSSPLSALVTTFPNSTLFAVVFLFVCLFVCTALRAQSQEAKLQVELATLQHKRSRLVRSQGAHYEQQRGGKGFLAGFGES